MLLRHSFFSSSSFSINAWTNLWVRMWRCVGTFFFSNRFHMINTHILRHCRTRSFAVMQKTIFFVIFHFAINRGNNLSSFVTLGRVLRFVTHTISHADRHFLLLFSHLETSARRRRWWRRRRRKKKGRKKRRKTTDARCSSNHWFWRIVEACLRDEKLHPKCLSICVFLRSVWFFFLLHVWKRLLENCVCVCEERNASIDGNEKNSCVNKIDR